MCRWSAYTGLAAALAALGFASGFGRDVRAAAPWSPPLTSWGEPDLQGIWTNFDKTPLEQPNPDPKGRDAEEAAEERHYGGIRRDTSAPSLFAAYTSPTSPRRPALVVDPPDGRIPVTPLAESTRDYARARIEDSWEYHSPSERCITRGMPAGMFPPNYNNGYQILQTPGFVTIVSEMIHDVRIIPTDGRPHVGRRIRLWNGDSRGRWEGRTLVVETTNYNGKGAVVASSPDVRMIGIPTSAALQVVERFTPVDGNTIDYRVTLTDPQMFSHAWTVALPFNRDQSYQIYEYACHEANARSIEGALRAGRLREGRAETRGRNAPPR